MKHFLFCLILFSTNFCDAQDLNGSVKWIYSQIRIGPPIDPDFHIIKKTKDTLINDRNASILESIFIKRNDTEGRIDTFGLTFKWIISYQEDRFYHYHFERDSFYILHDFSLDKGDTLLTIVGEYPMEGFEAAYIVDSTSTIMFNNEIRKVQYYGNDIYGSEYSISGEVVEGIGSAGWVTAQSGYVDPPNGGELLCFNQNDNLYPENAKCEIIASTYGEVQNETIFLPNPTSGILKITGTPIRDVRIYDVDGKQRLYYKMVTSSIDIGYLPQGVYIISGTKNGQTMVQKIVKLD